MAESVAAIFRREHSRVMAAMVRRTSGDFDLAEDAVQHAFAKAVESWETSGQPHNPQAWLMSVARNHVTDVVRRRQRHRGKVSEIALQAELDENGPPNFGDDRLRLIFTCCHPSLALEAQVALTLRTVCGLDTDAIARAFLVEPTTMSQRLVRAKRKIREAKIPFVVPEPDAIAQRISAVGAVIYLVLNAGYSSPSASAALANDRVTDLCGEAEWLARLVLALLPGDRELSALLALILLQGSRRLARVDEADNLVLLEDQDRSLWNQDAILEGRALVVTALTGGAPGAYAVQAAIAAVHASAPQAQATDWEQIVGLYDVLLGVAPTPIVELNRAVAIAMLRGPAVGLELLAEIETRGQLTTYPLLHAVKADLLRRTNDNPGSRFAYQRAIELTHDDRDRRFLSARLASL